MSRIKLLIKLSIILVVAFIVGYLLYTIGQVKV